MQRAGGVREISPESPMLRGDHDRPFAHAWRCDEIAFANHTEIHQIGARKKGSAYCKGKPGGL